MKNRLIKTLSVQKTAGLKEGGRTGHALAAKLSGHPGPMHMLELSEALQMEQAQTAASHHIFMQTQAATHSFWTQLIDSESAPGSLLWERVETPQVTEAAI